MSRPVKLRPGMWLYDVDCGENVHVQAVEAGRVVLEVGTNELSWSVWEVLGWLRDGSATVLSSRTPRTRSQRRQDKADERLMLQIGRGL